MERFRPVMLLAGVMLAGGSAHAQEGSFRVRAHVPAPPEVATALLDAVPVPDGATRLSRTPGGDSYWFQGQPEEAARLYLVTMPQRGYRLVYTSADGRMSSWRHADHRVEVQLHSVLGSTPATRIVVQATPSS